MFTQQPVFKSSAELVIIPVIVSRDGKFVERLTAADFVVSSNGHIEDIAFAEEIPAVAPSLIQSASADNASSNYRKGDSRQDNVILVLSFLNESKDQRNYVKKNLPQIAAAFRQSGMPLGVFAVTYHGLLKVHLPESPIDELVEAAGLFAGRTGKKPEVHDSTAHSAPRGARDAFIALQTAMTDQRLADAPEEFTLLVMRQIQQILEAYHGVPGRKKIVWMGGNFPFGARWFTPSGMKGNDPAKPLAEQVWQAISQENLLVYGITRGGANINPSGPGTDPNPGWAMDCIGITGMATITISGNPSNVCDYSPEKCVARFLKDAPRYYLIGFYLRADRSPGWHRVKVSGRNGVRIKARKSFYVADERAAGAATAEDHRNLVSGALTAPLDYTSLPLQLRWTLHLDAANNIELILSAPPGAITIHDSKVTVEFAAFVRAFDADEKDGVVESAMLDAPLTPDEQKQIQTGGFLYRHRMKLAPGRYFVRVMAIDQNTSRIGTVSTAVDVASPSVSPQN